MIIEYDIQKLTKALNDFNRATGIDINILKNDFSYVSGLEFQNNRFCDSVQHTQNGKKLCKESDIELLKKCKISKLPENHICHAGLVDVALPILYDDMILGYIIVGRMRPDRDFSVVRKYISEMGVDAEKAKLYYNEISLFEEDKIESISNIASMLVKYILLENMLILDVDTTLQKAIEYINENLGNDLSIKTISQKTNISKNMLYEKFYGRFNCTVNKYINKKRVESSVNMLANTDYSMEEISIRCGFSSASHYCKTFKKFFGISPIKYKKKMIIR